MIFGASPGELGLVGLLLFMVVLAPKVPRIGEWIAGWFSPPNAGPVDADDGEE